MRHADDSRLNSILAQLPQPRTVLELGCGNCPVSYYGNKLIAVDIDAAALKAAKQWPLHLLQAEITSLPFSSPFDLIIARHPDLDQHRDCWQAALKTAPQRLNAGGFLLTTTYSLPEIELIRSWMKTSPLTLIPLTAKTFLPPKLDGRDRFILFWQKLPVDINAHPC